MADRLEALTAVYVAARALKGVYPAVEGPSVTSPVPFCMVPLLRQLYSAVAAVDAVGEAAVDVAYPATYARRADGLCSAADCWRQADLSNGVCHHHSEWATAPQVRRRDGVFEGVQGE